MENKTREKINNKLWSLIDASNQVPSKTQDFIDEFILELSNIETVVTEPLGIEYGLDVTKVATDQTHNIKYEEDDILFGKDMQARKLWLQAKDKIGVVTDEKEEVEAVKFAEWIHDQMYTKYFGSEGENVGKWYKSYTKPDRKYYTLSELFTIYKGEKK